MGTPQKLTQTPNNSTSQGLCVWELTANRAGVGLINSIHLAEISSLLRALLGGVMAMVSAAPLNGALLVDRKLLTRSSVSLYLWHRTSLPTLSSRTDQDQDQRTSLPVYNTRKIRGLLTYLVNRRAQSRTVDLLLVEQAL